MKRNCLAALGVLLTTGWLWAQEPMRKEVYFDVFPGNAIVTLVSGGVRNQYPANQPVAVEIPYNEFELWVEAPGWTPYKTTLMKKDFVHRWPTNGTRYLMPALPGWLLLGLLVPPWIWRRRQQRPPAAPRAQPAAPVTAPAPEAQLPWELAQGSQIDHYCIQERLGEGASGVVYRVRDGDTELALKLIKPQQGQNKDVLPRFRREMKMMCQLKHPNIPYLADVGEFRGMSYLVMELLGTITLQDKLRPGPLPPAQAWNVLCQLARALAFCHRQGILHRDIKPENVIWGDGQRVRLTDFGLARHSNSSTLTQEGTIMGTPSYMAPEIVLGEGASAASDQYSLGCLAYHLISGSPPFEAENPMAVLMQHIDKEPAPLKQASAAFGEIILRMLRKRPEQRFASVDELLTRLEKLGA